MATKRRKVWVNEYQGYLSSSMHKSLREARMGRGTVSRAKSVCFVERLPGDVVRTKDEEVALESAIDRYTEAWETAYATHTDEARRAVTTCGRNLRALLRGRR